MIRLFDIFEEDVRKNIIEMRTEREKDRDDDEIRKNTSSREDTFEKIYTTSSRVS